MADYAFRTMEDRLGIEKLWASGKTPTMEMAAEGIRKFFHAIELATTLRCARALEPAMAHRYLHTKKRICKQYEKRIMAWFREVFL